MTRFRILINGEAHTVGPEPISYERLVEMAGMTGHPSMVYHWRLDDISRSGMVYKGRYLQPMSQMKITVVHTGDA